MLNITFRWRLSQIPEQTVKKHCKMCGRISVLRIQMYEGITQMEKIYTNMQYINAKKSYVE